MGKIKVLIAENDTLVTLVLKQQLHSLGFKVSDAVRNTNDALKSIDKYRPDLIMLDFSLEGKSSGNEIAELIQVKTDVPIIYLISDSDEIDFEAEAASVAGGYLLKPFNERELELSIDLALTKYRHEKRLKLSEDKYHNIFMNAHIGIYRSTPAGKIIEANPALIKLLGYSSLDELTLKNLETDGFYSDDTRHRFKELMERNGEVINFETRILKKDGSTLIVLENSKLFHDPESDEVYYEGTVQDITTKKEKEAELDSLAKFPGEDPYPVLRITQDGQLIYANESSANLLESWECKVGQYIPDRIRQTVQSASLSKRTKEIEMEASNRIYSLTIAPISGTTYVNIYGRDITEMKNLQIQLQQAQKMEAIGQLAGGIAHDFNNILTAINGYAEMCLIKLPPKDRLHDYITGILKAGKRAGSLTKKLLAFSRKQIVELKTLDVNALIEELSQMLSRLIGEDIQVEKRLSKNIAHIQADPGQIEQVLTNLIVNARDAIIKKNDPTAKRKITVETGQVYVDEKFSYHHEGSHPGFYVVLTVSDNGIGMDKTLQSKIFEPFFTTKKIGEGTGLGLAMVYGIVKQNSGNVYVYSEPNQGATFKIYWPALSEGTVIPYKRTYVREAEKGQETILIVEDDENIRSFITTALESLGYKVLSAVNGQDALDKMKNTEQQIDLAISDVIMPAMGGKEFADQLKIIYPHLRVLFTSGYTGNQIVHSGVLENDVEFIQKPYSINELSQKVRQILDGK